MVFVCFDFVFACFGCALVCVWLLWVCYSLWVLGWLLTFCFVFLVCVLSFRFTGFCCWFCYCLCCFGCLVFITDFGGLNVVG